MPSNCTEGISEGVMHDLFLVFAFSVGFMRF